MKNKKILFIGVIGGMSYSTKLATELGYKVYCSDYYNDSQAKEYAYKSYNISTNDINSISKLIEDENISAIFSGFSDVNIRTTALLCEKYNLPCYINEKQINLLQDKTVFKKLCHKYNIPTPKEYFNIDKIEYSIIVKPSDSYAAKGITVCNSMKDLPKALDKAKSLSKNNKIVIEDYIDGEEVMTHFVMLNKKLKITSILNRKLSSKFNVKSKALAPILIENSLKYKQEVLSIEKNLEKMFVDLDFTNIVGFLQCMVKKDKVLFFEPAIRFEGNLSELFNIYSNDINIVKTFVDYSYTGTVNDELLEKINIDFDKYCCNVTLFLMPGIVSHYYVNGNVFDNKEIVDIQRYVSIGKKVTVEDIDTYNDIAYRIIIVAENKEKVIDIINNVSKSLIVTDIYEKNMIDWKKAIDSLK